MILLLNMSLGIKNTKKKEAAIGINCNQMRIVYCNIIKSCSNKHKNNRKQQHILCNYFWLVHKFQKKHIAKKKSSIMNRLRSKTTLSGLESQWSSPTLNLEDTDLVSLEPIFFENLEMWCRKVGPLGMSMERTPSREKRERISSSLCCLSSLNSLWKRCHFGGSMGFSPHTLRRPLSTTTCSWSFLKPAKHKDLVSK